MISNPSHEKYFNEITRDNDLKHTGHSLSKDFEFTTHAKPIFFSQIQEYNKMQKVQIEDDQSR